MRVRKHATTQTSGTTRTTEAIYLPGLTLRLTRSDDGQTVTVVEALHELRLDAGRTGARALHWETGLPKELANDALRYSYGELIGSIGLELDEHAALISREEYYPYGGTAVWAARSQVEADTKFIRYSGQERDATGLYDYGWRSYQPWLGRWLNPDPAGTVDGLNLFRMVRNNPIKFSDAFGLSPYQGKGDRFERLVGSEYHLLSRGLTEIRSDDPIFSMEIEGSISIAHKTLGIAQKRILNEFNFSSDKNIITSYINASHLDQRTALNIRTQLSSKLLSLRNFMGRHKNQDLRERIVTVKPKDEKDNTEAFVIKSDAHKRIFINRNHEIGRAKEMVLSLVHEASHLALGTFDHWYLEEENDNLDLNDSRAISHSIGIGFARQVGISSRKNQRFDGDDKFNAMKFSTNENHRGFIVNRNADSISYLAVFLARDFIATEAIKLSSATRREHQKLRNFKGHFARS
ncbi:hypothetical protein WL40_18385 [Burkholderia ubonensis]|nr:hypothetical protein WL40_18385 [Burkholderia ubonensis]